MPRLFSRDRRTSHSRRRSRPSLQALEGKELMSTFQVSGITSSLTANRAGSTSSVIDGNHNEAQATSGLKVQSGIKLGGIDGCNHNEAQARGGRKGPVRDQGRGGRVRRALP